MKVKQKTGLLLELKKILRRPLSLGEIKREISDAHIKNLAHNLKLLVKGGDIVKIRGGRYGFADEMNLVIGSVQGHPDGYGFVIPEEKEDGTGAEQKDVFIGSGNFQKAMHGDRVVCRVEKADREGRLQGSVIRILERAHETVTGVFESRGRSGVVVPTLKRITHVFRIPPGKTLRAKGGQVVVARITAFPEKLQTPEAEVIKLLGFPNDPQVERKMIIRQYELPDSFPAAAENAAKKIKEPAVKDIKGRRDLRGKWIVTIDGETAKDFDDAVSIEKLSNGYELGVHIADVSHYVTPGSALDRGAYERGTSTYFPGSVIPMLPFGLSDDVCSLRPHRDRLTLSAFMRFDGGGKLKDYSFVSSVINSSHRMTYTEVAAILEDPGIEKSGEKPKNLSVMYELFKKLRSRRIEGGSLDFDLPEPEFVLDMQGEPEKIIKAERNDAHRLIEEFMLAANRCAADFLGKGSSLYRVHPEPDAGSMKEFFEFAQRLGHDASPKKSIHKRLQEILASAHGTPAEKLLNFLMLRAMQQASYSPNNIGHFGLAFSDYTHFTSPIRRYPDLVVHRLIKARLAKRDGGPDHEEMLEVGRHCSERERVSEKAERDVIDALKARFIADREGEEFDGIISGVTAFGIFVELDGIFAEGMMRLTDLHDDYYIFNEKEHSLVGKRTGKVFRLGSPVRVRVKNVDLLRHEVNLEPVTDRKNTSKGTGKKKPHRRRRKKR